MQQSVRFNPLHQITKGNIQMTLSCSQHHVTRMQKDNALRKSCSTCTAEIGNRTIAHGVTQCFRQQPSCLGKEASVCVVPTERLSNATNSSTPAFRLVSTTKRYPHLA